MQNEVTKYFSKIFEFRNFRNKFKYFEKKKYFGDSRCKTTLILMHYQIWCVLYQKTIIYTKFFFLYQKIKFGVFCIKKLLSIPNFF